MKYNILTVCNRSYFPFLDIFLNSLFENSEIEKINKIYIVDIDLGPYKNFLLKSDKIEFLTPNLLDEYLGVHSDGWYEATKQKTEYLKYLLPLIPNDEPIILIDSDVCVLEDLHSIIDTEYDVQVTSMAKGSHISGSGVEIFQIACFLIFNNIEKAKKFVDGWIEEMDKLHQEGRNKPHETPAMNLLLRKYEKTNDIKINYLNEKIVCADLALYPESKAVHFKSNGSNYFTPYVNFSTRLKSVEFYDVSRSNLNFKNYLQQEPFFEWCKEYT
jgi:lipopolysaccharide biosynthesis glycosyltransferase